MLAAVHTPLPGLVSVKGMTSAPLIPFRPSCALTPVAVTSAVMTVAFICRVFRSTMIAAAALALLVTAGITSLPVRVADNPLVEKYSLVYWNAALCIFRSQSLISVAMKLLRSLNAWYGLGVMQSVS